MHRLVLSIVHYRLLVVALFYHRTTQIRFSRKNSTRDKRRKVPSIHLCSLMQLQPRLNTSRLGEAVITLCLISRNQELVGEENI